MPVPLMAKVELSASEGEVCFVVAVEGEEVMEIFQGSMVMVAQLYE